MDQSKLTELDVDALRESANVGAGNASIGLSEIIKKRVNITVSDVNFLSLEQLSSAIGGPQKMVVGVYTPIKIGMAGNMVMTLLKDSALLLSNEILSINTRKDDILTEIDKKCLKTVGNIISEYYIESLNNFLSVKMAFDETNIVATFGESLCDMLTVTLDAETDDFILIKTDFNVEETLIEGKFMFLIAVKSLDEFLTALRKNLM